jgi:hypothetical protein
MSPESCRPARGIACVALFLSMLGLVSGAQAQWAWRDADGHTTFSDAPPPPSVGQTAILHQPSALAPEPRQGAGSGGSDRAGASYAGNPVGDTPNPRTDAPAPAAPDNQRRPAAPPAKTLAEQEADFRKRMAEQAKAEQKAADDEAKAAQRAANCEQARGMAKMLDDGTRLMRPDAEGNRNFLDDDQRAAERAKVQETIDHDCS